MTTAKLLTMLLTCLSVWSTGAMCAMAVARADQSSPLTGEVKKIDGTAVDLAKYKGKVVLVVNVASRCGYTPQYTGLQKLYETYKDKGLVVVNWNCLRSILRGRHQVVFASLN